MYHTATDHLYVSNIVKGTEKFLKNNSLVLILRQIDNGFITFTSNTLQP
jgi:hypothetical protein